MQKWCFDSPACVLFYIHFFVEKLVLILNMEYRCWCSSWTFGKMKLGTNMRCLLWYNNSLMSIRNDNPFNSFIYEHEKPKEKKEGKWQHKIIKDYRGLAKFTIGRIIAQARSSLTIQQKKEHCRFNPIRVTCLLK